MPNKIISSHGTELLIYFACGPFADQLPVYAQNRIMISAVAQPERQVMLVVYNEAGVIAEDYKAFTGRFSCVEHPKNITFCTLQELAQEGYFDRTCIEKIDKLLEDKTPAKAKAFFQQSMVWSFTIPKESNIKVLALADLDFSLIRPFNDGNFQLKVQMNMDGNFLNKDGHIALHVMRCFLDVYCCQAMKIDDSTYEGIQDNLKYGGLNRSYAWLPVFADMLGSYVRRNNPNNQLLASLSSDMVVAFCERAFLINQGLLSPEGLKNINDIAASVSTFYGEASHHLTARCVSSIIKDVLIHEMRYVNFVAHTMQCDQGDAFILLRSISELLVDTSYDVACGEVIHNPWMISILSAEEKGLVDRQGINTITMQDNINALHRWLASENAQAEPVDSVLRKVVKESIEKEGAYLAQFVSNEAPIHGALQCSSASPANTLSLSDLVIT